MIVITTYLIVMVTITHRLVMVRSYILTDRERDIIEFQMETNKMLNGYRELKHAINKLDLSKLRADLELIEKFLGEG